MADVIVDGTSEFKASIVNKFVSAVDDTLDMAIACCSTSGTTTLAVTNVAGFQTTCTDTGKGDYTLNFKAGKFASAPVVVANGSDADTDAIIVNVTSISTSAVTMHCKDEAGAATDCNMRVIAIGLRA